MIRAYHLCGLWQLKDEFCYLQRDPSLMPFLPKVIDPKEIVNRARETIVPPPYEEISTSNIDEVSTASSKVKHKLRGDSQLALANEAILDKRVTLTDKGCWIVRGADDETPYAVRLFLKESCSCPAVKMCYHIVACKLMIGQDVNDDANPNMALFSQKVRQKNKEKPSGRKPPRKNDFGKMVTNG